MEPVPLPHPNFWDLLLIQRRSNYDFWHFRLSGQQQEHVGLSFFSEIINVTHNKNVILEVLEPGKKNTRKQKVTGVKTATSLFPVPFKIKFPRS